MKRYDWGLWGFGFDGYTDLWFRTPWFALELAFEAEDWEVNYLWWGMKLVWGRRPNVKEGELMFLHFQKVVFHEVPKRLTYQQKRMRYFQNVAP